MTLAVDDALRLIPGLIAEGIAEAQRELATKPAASPHQSIYQATGTVVSVGTGSAIVQLDEDEVGVVTPLQAAAAISVGARIVALMKPNGGGTIVGGAVGSAGSGGGGADDYDTAFGL